MFFFVSILVVGDNRMGNFSGMVLGHPIELSFEQPVWWICFDLYGPGGQKRMLSTVYDMDETSEDASVLGSTPRRVASYKFFLGVWRVLPVWPINGLFKAGPETEGGEIPRRAEMLCLTHRIPSVCKIAMCDFEKKC